MGALMAGSTPHDLAEQPFFGTPRPLPRVLLCNSTAEVFCGRTWTANTEEQYAEFTGLREAHEVLCASLMENRGRIAESISKSKSVGFPRVKLP